VITQSDVYVMLQQMVDEPIENVLCVWCGRKHGTPKQQEELGLAWEMTKGDPLMRKLLEGQIKSRCWTKVRGDPKGTCIASIMSGGDKLELRLADLCKKVVSMSLILAHIRGGMSGVRAMALIDDFLEPVEEDKP
jgi:hypothetical protein